MLESLEPTFLVMHLKNNRWCKLKFKNTGQLNINMAHDLTICVKRLFDY